MIFSMFFSEKVWENECSVQQNLFNSSHCESLTPSVPISCSSSTHDTFDSLHWECAVYSTPPYTYCTPTNHPPTPPPPLMLSGHLAPSTCGEAQGTSGGHHLSGHLGTLGIFWKRTHRYKNAKKQRHNAKVLLVSL